VRYLNYIINLAAKAFIFNGDKDSFEDVEINNVMLIIALKAEINF
jgi:hypothetical protein